MWVLLRGKLSYCLFFQDLPWSESEILWFLHLLWFWTDLNESGRTVYSFSLFSGQTSLSQNASSRMGINDNNFLIFGYFLCSVELTVSLSWCCITQTPLPPICDYVYVCYMQDLTAKSLLYKVSSILLLFKSFNIRLYDITPRAASRGGPGRAAIALLINHTGPASHDQHQIKFYCLSLNSIHSHIHIKAIILEITYGVRAVKRIKVQTVYCTYEQQQLLHTLCRLLCHGWGD